MCEKFDHQILFQLAYRSPGQSHQQFCVSRAGANIMPLFNVTYCRRYSLHSGQWQHFCSFTAYVWCASGLSTGAHSLLSDIIVNHSVNHQLFTDDTQLQKSAPFSEVINLTKELNACTDDIKTWMMENHLKLNDNKTEALPFPFSSSLKPSTVSLPDSTTLGSHNIPFILDSKSTL